MKRKISRLNLLLHWLWGISIAVLICTVQISSQQGQQQPPEFIIGAFGPGIESRYDVNFYNSFDSSGLNTIVVYADEFTRPKLSGINVIAFNQDSQTDWINYYATSYYSKWESEQDIDTPHVGVKHEAGQIADWRDTLCWSTIGVTAPACSLVYGPHYRQEKRYKRWFSNNADPQYTARFRMALAYNPQLVDSGENVCVIKVVYRYAEVHGPGPGNYTVTDTVFKIDTLTVSDFNADSSFKSFQFPEPEYYTYPSKFKPDDFEEKTILPREDYPYYSDSDGDNGIQFWVDWLRDDDLCTLYIDYTEVYDNDGWNYYINPQTHNQVISNIKSYAANYSDWSNLIYWYSHDEPYTIDAYTPMRIVDSLVIDTTGVPLITEFYPDWRIFVNGDSHLVKYYEMAQPQTIMMEFINYFLEGTTLEWEYEQQRSLLQELSIASPDFLYEPMIAAPFTKDKIPCWLREPTANELNASILLGLAHGSKGIVFWNNEE